MKFICEKISSVVLADTKIARSRISWNGHLHFIRGQHHCFHFKIVDDNHAFFGVIHDLVLIFFYKQEVHALHWEIAISPSISRLTL